MFFDYLQATSVWSYVLGLPKVLTFGERVSAYGATLARSPKRVSANVIFGENVPSGMKYPSHAIFEECLEGRAKIGKKPKVFFAALLSPVLDGFQ